MLEARLIRRLFKALNEELRKSGAKGEIGLCGGAVMCLVFEARKATKDVDALFHPTREIRAAARAVARKFSLPEDWLNDAAKGFFLREPPKDEVMELSHLRVWAPSADYMLAMKCVSARFDSQDSDDVRFLVRWLGLKTPAEVFSIIEKYYPHERIPVRTQFFVEELLQ
ncbi:MAG TPA: hypothetical protein DCM05_13705 [Elusimicrobia bacterium]|nr:hypothetical protein [Elusimicrobiota bacterium]